MPRLGTLPEHDHYRGCQLPVGCHWTRIWAFPQVILERHHRLFFSSDKCGAMAMAYLHHALLGVMLPTSQDEAVTAT